jgi:hypothetical protein
MDPQLFGQNKSNETTDWFSGKQQNRLIGPSFAFLAKDGFDSVFLNLFPFHSSHETMYRGMTER